MRELYGLGVTSFKREDGTEKSNRYHMTHGVFVLPSCLSLSLSLACASSLTSVTPCITRCMPRMRSQDWVARNGRSEVPYKVVELPKFNEFLETAWADAQEVIRSEDAWKEKRRQRLEGSPPL